MCCNYVLAKIFRRCAANKIQSTFSWASFGIFLKRNFCSLFKVILFTFNYYQFNYICFSLNLHDKNTWVKIFFFNREFLFFHWKFTAQLGKCIFSFKQMKKKIFVERIRFATKDPKIFWNPQTMFSTYALN